MPDGPEATDDAPSPPLQFPGKGALPPKRDLAELGEDLLFWLAVGVAVGFALVAGYFLTRGLVNVRVVEK